MVIREPLPGSAVLIPMRTAGALLLALLLPGAAPGTESALEPPVRLEADGKPIDVLGGHAAPSVADLDGDGVRDLLVGQFVGEGKNPFEATMRSYRNAGTDGEPRLAASGHLESGGARAWVPSG